MEDPIAEQRKRTFKSAVLKMNGESFAQKLRKTKRQEYYQLKRTITGEFTEKEESIREENEQLRKIHSVFAVESMGSTAELSVIYELLPRVESGLALLLLRRLRRHLSNYSNPKVSEVMQFSFVPFLHEIIRLWDQSSKLEALWCLTNIAASKHEYCQKIFEAGVPQTVLALISEPELSELIIWLLGNLSADCEEYRNELLKLNLLHLLNKLIEPREIKRQTLEILLWTYSNLIRGEPSLTISQVSPFLSKAAQFLSIKHNEIILPFLQCLFHLTDIDILLLPPFIPHIPFKQISALLSSSSSSVRTEALRILNNICLGPQLFVQTVLNNLTKLPSINIGVVDEELSEIFQIISNISTFSESNIKYLLKFGVYEEIIFFVNSTGKFQHKKEAIVGLSLACETAAEEELSSLVKLGILEAFKTAISIGDSEMIMGALDGIERLLEVSDDNIDKFDSIGGIAKLEELQMNDNMEIFKRVQGILEVFFYFDPLNQFIQKFLYCELEYFCYFIII